MRKRGTPVYQQKLDNYLILTLSLLGCSILCLFIMSLIDFIDKEDKYDYITNRFRTAQQTIEKTAILLDIARLFNLKIRIQQMGDIKKAIWILHGTLAFIISMNLIMSLIIDNLNPGGESVGELVAKGFYHLVDLIIIVSYIYLYRAIRDQYAKIRKERQVGN